MSHVKGCIEGVPRAVIRSGIRSKPSESAKHRLMIESTRQDAGERTCHIAKEPTLPAGRVLSGYFPSGIGEAEVCIWEASDRVLGK